MIRRAVAEAGVGDRVEVIGARRTGGRRGHVVDASFIVKGLRTAADFEIEQQMALTNQSVTGVRTVYLPCRADRGYISSRFVREIARYGGDGLPHGAGPWPTPVRLFPRERHA